MAIEPRLFEEFMDEAPRMENSRRDLEKDGLGMSIHARFTHLGGVDLDLPNRGELAADLERRARIAELFVTGDLGGGAGDLRG